MLHILSTPALTSTRAELSTSGHTMAGPSFEGNRSDSDRNDPPFPARCIPPDASCALPLPTTAPAYWPRCCHGRRIVEEMDGRIAPANRPQGGAEFEILLPVVEAQAAAA
jgi:hypothetical protein